MYITNKHIFINTKTLKERVKKNPFYTDPMFLHSTPKRLLLETFFIITDIWV